MLLSDKVLCLNFHIVLLDFPLEQLSYFRVSVRENVEEDVIFCLAEAQDFCRDRCDVLAPDGGVLHELEQTCLRDLVLTEDVEELEYEQQVVLLLLIHERLDRIVVVRQIDNDLEIVLKTWGKNACHLICDRVLIALGEIRPELLLVLEASVLIGHLVEPLDEGRVRLGVEVEVFLPQRFRLDLLLILRCLLDRTYLAIAGLVAFVIRLSIR